MNTWEAEAMVKAYGKRAGALNRLPKRTLATIDAAALHAAGTMRLFGSLSRDELIADILAAEFPFINDARAVYFRLCNDADCPATGICNGAHTPGIEVSGVTCTAGSNSDAARNQRR